MSSVAVTITGPIQFTRGIRANLPSIGLPGQAFFCTDTGEVFVWNGTSMVGPAAAMTVEIAARIAADAAEATARANGDTAETTRATAAEALLAPLASPALTGNPTVPTQAANTNNTRAASTAYADAAVSVEKTRAQAAEALLATITALNAEVTRATAAEATKQNIINFADAESPSGQGAGNTVLTLAHAPVTAGSLRVFRNGVRQALTTDYTLAGSTLTLLLALSSTDVIVVDYRY